MQMGSSCQTHSDKAITGVNYIAFYHSNYT